MNFVEEKTRAETIYQRELTDQEFAEVLLSRIEHMKEEIEANDECIADLSRRLTEATQKDEWTELRNKVEEILNLPGNSHTVVVSFFDHEKITMSFAVDELPIKSTVEDWEGEF